MGFNPGFKGLNSTTVQCMANCKPGHRLTRCF